MTRYNPELTGSQRPGAAIRRRQPGDLVAGRFRVADGDPLRDPQRDQAQAVRRAQVGDGKDSGGCRAMSADVHVVLGDCTSPWTKLSCLSNTFVVCWM
jgi:hypothetical protein